MALTNFTVCCPIPRNPTGLSRFALQTEWVRHFLYTGGIYSLRCSSVKTAYLPLYLLVRACQHLRLFTSYDAFKSSPMFALPFIPNPLPPDAGSVSLSSRTCLQFSAVILSPELHTSSLPIMHVRVRNGWQNSRLLLVIIHSNSF